jgi:hypothetical protein
MTDCVAIESPKFDVNINAESIPRVALYYKLRPISNGEIDFPLPINGASKHFENTSTSFYIVGNIPGAEVVFSDSDFTLYSLSGRDNVINLTGEFVFNNNHSSALQMISIPVLKNILFANSTNGFKVHFKSKSLAGNYSQGGYANSFTLLVKPTL